MAKMAEISIEKGFLLDSPIFLKIHMKQVHRSTKKLVFSKKVRGSPLTPHTRKKIPKFFHFHAVFGNFRKFFRFRAVFG